MDEGSRNQGSMGKRIPEWLLAKLSSRERASEIVGDLLEQRTSSARFWWTTFQVALMMAVRPAIGFTFAFFTFAWAFLPFTAQVISFHSSEMSPITQVSLRIAICAAIVSVWTWSVTVLLFVRYGFRDTVTRVALFFSCVLTLVSCTFRERGITVCLAAIFALGLALCIALPHLRSAFGTVALGTATIAVVFIIPALTVTEALSNALVRHRQIADATALFCLVTWFGSLIVGWIVLGRTHRRFIRP